MIYCKLYIIVKIVLGNKFIIKNMIGIRLWIILIIFINCCIFIKLIISLILIVFFSIHYSNFNPAIFFKCTCCNIKNFISFLVIFKNYSRIWKRNARIINNCKIFYKIIFNFKELFKISDIITNYLLIILLKWIFFAQLKILVR